MTFLLALWSWTVLALIVVAFLIAMSALAVAVAAEFKEPGEIGSTSILFNPIEVESDTRPREFDLPLKGATVYHSTRLSQEDQS